MKITCLIDNCALDGFKSEHGLSLWIEACGHKFLFDTGETDAFLANAKALGIDIGEAEFCVISHGHHDHGGGIRAFFEANKHARVYVREGAFGPRYSNNPGEGKRYIGIDASLQGGERIVETDERCEICPGILLFSGVTGNELHSPANDVLMGADGETPDEFAHEQNMLIAEGERRVLIAGCAHRGIANIMRRALELSGGKLDAVIGGMHLAIPGTSDINIPLVDGTADYLLASPGTVYYTGHCTGLGSFARLQERMGERVKYLHAGESIEL